MDSFFLLTECKPNILCKIATIEDDCSFVMRRLGDLGFFPGENITLLKKSMLNKSVLILLNQNKLMLRGDLAEKIIVSEVKSEVSFGG